MKIEVIKHEFSVCKLRNISSVDLTGEFCFLGKTDEEVSLVCITENVPVNIIEREDGWRAFRIQGVLDFSLVGILSRLSTLLADSGIGIFAISTYNTDYILTKAQDYHRALEVLKQRGYHIC